MARTRCCIRPLTLTTKIHRTLDDSFFARVPQHYGRLTLSKGKKDVHYLYLCFPLSPSECSQAFTRFSIPLCFRSSHHLQTTTEKAIKLATRLFRAPATPLNKPLPDSKISWHLRCARHMVPCFKRKKPRRWDGMDRNRAIEKR
jgi:hypothetical protein